MKKRRKQKPMPWSRKTKVFLNFGHKLHDGAAADVRRAVEEFDRNEGIVHGPGVYLGVDGREFVIAIYVAEAVIWEWRDQRLVPCPRDIADTIWALYIQIITTGTSDPESTFANPCPPTYHGRSSGRSDRCSRPVNDRKFERKF